MRAALTLALLMSSVAVARADDVTIRAALDAVGPLAGDDYDPRPVIAAVNALQPLGKERGVLLLRSYLATHPRADDRGGLFIVLRTLLEPPPRAASVPADACTPEQKDIAAGGCWRPPRLGAPSPPAPKDLRSLRFPGFVLGDVPLSLVSGYALGGMAERLVDHLDALAPLAGWRSTPLVPKSAGEVRYLFVHYGQWSLNDEVGRLVERQLKRLEAGPAPPCFELGLACIPRATPSIDALKSKLALDGMITFTELSPPGKHLVAAVITWPTDGVSLHTVAVWSFTAHFAEWRLVLLQETDAAIQLTPIYDAKRGALVLRAADPKAPDAAVISLAHIPYGTAD